MAFDAVNAVKLVEIFMQRDLEDGAASLSSDDSGPRKEQFPHAIELLAVLLRTLFCILQPILVPPPNGSAVVHAEHIDALHFKTGRFDLIDHPA